jgi:two-component system CheB/CheR fusion protein
MKGAKGFKPMNPEPPSKPDPTVVGIGASAGGLAALKKFLDNVPHDSGLAFVVVVHLSPDHESHLAELLQPHVRFPVEQVNQTTIIQPNHVYIIPPNANLNAIDTHLRLTKLEERRQERAPIDYFFRTLASTHDGHAIAVVLTGTGSDGTLGVKDIKANGGVVIVQDPTEAEYDGMPQSAIATGLVDFVRPVAEIPASILRFDRVQPRVPLPSDEEDIPTDERALLHKLFTQLRVRTDRDFSRYKRSTVLRRVARRMQLNYIEDLGHYVEKASRTSGGSPCFGGRSSDHSHALFSRPGSF